MIKKDIVIELEHVYKKYRLYEKKADRIKEFLDPLGRDWHRKFTALKNISLQVEKGEVLGIVGRNGSGKSTLLKVISGIMPPTSGKMHVNGNIVPLIELGAGFNPDFTGLENIYFYNSIHGFSKTETDALLDDILNFAEIGDFIHQPLRVYSSGMRARLAFAVSINIRPDILILDEVLSVGDEMFRRKCFAKMEEFFRGGKTVLFVSHSSNSINELCTRCIWLNEGELILDGPPKMVTTMYDRLAHSRQKDKTGLLEEIRLLNQNTELKMTVFEEINKQKDISGNSEPGFPWLQTGETDIELENGFVKPQARFIPDMLPKSTVTDCQFDVEMTDIKIVTPSGERVNVILSGDEYECIYKIKFNEQLKNIYFRIMFTNETGYTLGAMNTQKTGMKLPVIEPGNEYSVNWRFTCNLLTGYYFVSLRILADTAEGMVRIATITDAMVFQVTEPGEIRQGGFVLMNIQPAITLLNQPIEKGYDT